jgi:hypothetical protein
MLTLTRPHWSAGRTQRQLLARSVGKWRAESRAGRFLSVDALRGRKEGRHRAGRDCPAQVLRRRPFRVTFRLPRRAGGSDCARAYRETLTATVYAGRRNKTLAYRSPGVRPETGADRLAAGKSASRTIGIVHR